MRPDRSAFFSLHELTDLLADSISDAINVLIELTVQLARRVHIEERRLLPTKSHALFTALNIFERSTKSTGSAYAPQHSGEITLTKGRHDIRRSA